jgi:manganese-dependent inorganic pyrophosphatase
MEKKVYVIGHVNPDTDSVAAAVGYAALKNKLGQLNVYAAMAGEPNPQTRYLLDRIGIEPPIYLADVHPKVRDIINRRPVTATAVISLKEALELFHRHTIRVLPVVDDRGAPIGIVSLLKLSEKYLVAGTDRKRGIDASLSSLAGCLGGTFLTGEPEDRVEHFHLVYRRNAGRVVPEKD